MENILSTYEVDDEVTPPIIFILEFLYLSNLNQTQP
jgi:hypothetical protein